MKARFNDPLSDMGSFKMSLLRLIGMERLTLQPFRMRETEKCGCAPRRNLWWVAARVVFNIFCSVVALLCVCCGNQEQILVCVSRDDTIRRS